MKRPVWLVLFLFLLSCARPRPTGPLPQPAGEPPSARPIEWGEWGTDGLAAARDKRRPVLLAVLRRSGPDAASLDALERDPEAAQAITKRTIPIRADADEWPELADFARLSATLLGTSPEPPFVLLLGADAVPIGVVSGDTAAAGWPVAVRARIEEAHAAAGVRVEADGWLEALQRAQTPERATQPLTHETALSCMRRTAASVPAGPHRRPHRFATMLLLSEASALEDGPAAPAAAQAMLAAQEPTSAATLEGRALALLVRARLYQGSAEESAALAASASRLRELLGEGDLFRWAAGDERVFTDANGMAIAALTLAGASLGRAEDVDLAGRAASELVRRVGPATALRRGFEGGRSMGPARLDDYAWLAAGLVALHNVGSDPQWLQTAESVVTAAIGTLWDNAGGGFFLHAEPHAPLPVRLKTGFDAGRPSGNAIMVLVLDALGERTGRAHHRQLARRTLEAFAGDALRAPSGVDGLLAAALNVLPPSSLPALEPEPERGSPRQVRGAVTLDARPSREALRPGETAEILIRIEVAPGHVVTPAGAASGAVPFSVALLETDLAGGAPVYRPFSSGTGLQEAAVLRLRVPADAAKGPRRVRVAVRYEACPAVGACPPPERAILEVALEIV